MSEKLPVDGFEWVEDISEIDEHFIKNYDEDSNVGYFIEAEIEYPKELQNKHSGLPFLPERMKANKCKKLVCNLYDKKDYVDHIRSLKQALNNGLKIKKIHKVLKFNQRSWLKSYIDLIILLKDHYQWIKIKKVIGMMKDELGQKIMKECIGLRPKCYSYLTDDGNGDKKAKQAKKYVIKKEIMFNNYVECLKEKKKI